MTSKNRLAVQDMVIFAMLGALLLIGKILFEPLPNIHPLASLIGVYTVTYREKALIPIYVYVILQGLFSGFNMWWIPYTYIWTCLWALFMIIPRNIAKTRALYIYPLICALHGILFGTLYAPAQALIFGLNFSGMIKWIVAGLPFDLLHAGGNFVAGFLVLPLSNVLTKITNKSWRQRRSK